MAARKPPAGDLTGKKRAELEKQQAEEAQKRAEELAMATVAQNQANETEILDVTGNPGAPVVVDDVTDTTVEPVVETPAPAPTPAPEVVVSTDEDATEIIRVAEDLQAVTIGDKTYDFVAGRKYKVEKNVADVLRWAGRLYDRA